MAVLTGRGRNFCAGYDLKELAAMESARSVVGEYDVGPAPMVIYHYTNWVLLHIHRLLITGSYPSAIEQTSDSCSERVCSGGWT